MKKTMSLIFMLAFALSMLAPASAFAAMQKSTAFAKPGKGIVDAGNTMCPLTGAPVSGKDFVSYKGKRYGLCCPMCKKAFLKEPEKYIAKLKAAEKAGLTPGVEPIISEPKKIGKIAEKKTMQR